jgi:AmmeMemoRadiSam system protein B
MTRVRPPAVANQFYPGNPHALKDWLLRTLNSAETGGGVPKVIVAPHAGYVYSGAVAASAYRLLVPARDRISRVVLLGPAHRVYLRGIALSSADAFATPLGQVPIDRDACALIAAMPGVGVADQAHELEHSLEVHLPFLQVLLADFRLVPLVVGDVPPETVAAVLDQLWGGDETLIVVSSDLSHYHDYATANRLDLETTNAIESLQYERITPENACGCRPLNGLLYLARNRGLAIETLDRCNSGDTAGPRDRVVGYGAYVIH